MVILTVLICFSFAVAVYWVDLHPIEVAYLGVLPYFGMFFIVTISNFDFRTEDQIFIISTWVYSTSCLTALLNPLIAVVVEFVRQCVQRFITIIKIARSIE